MGKTFIMDHPLIQHKIELLEEKKQEQKISDS